MPWECRLIQALWRWVFMCECQRAQLAQSHSAWVGRKSRKSLCYKKFHPNQSKSVFSQWPAVLRLCWNPLRGGEARTVKGKVLSSPDGMHLSCFCCRWFCGMHNESCISAIFTVKHTLTHRLALPLHRDIGVSTSREGWLLLQLILNIAVVVRPYGWADRPPDRCVRKV